MSASQRRKGAKGELEIARDLEACLNLPDKSIKRELSQTRDGGCDLRAGRLAIEVKRRKSLKTLYAWMAQCVASKRPVIDESFPDLPVVIVRQDGEEPLVIVRLGELVPVARHVLDLFHGVEKV